LLLYISFHSHCKSYNPSDECPPKKQIYDKNRSGIVMSSSLCDYEWYEINSYYEDCFHDTKVKD